MSRKGTQREAKGAPGARVKAIVDDHEALGDLVADLRSPDRAHAVVAVAWSLDGDEPVLATSQIRTIVDRDTRVYVIPSDALLRALRTEVGSRLALASGAVRIWWPGITRRSDPEDHPLVVPLEGEPPEHTLAAFARAFQLSRPYVRREIKLAEDAQALAEHRLQEAEEKETITAQRLRDAHVERNSEAMRAEAVGETEAALRTVKRQLQAACGLAGVGRQLGLRALSGDAAEQASILQAFGKNVAASRANAGLNQVELSHRCFIRADQVSLLECGGRVPSLLILRVLAQAFDVSIGDLTAGLPPLTREAGRKRMLALIAKTPRTRHHKRYLEQASGLPQPYAASLLNYMDESGEIVKEGDGWELATPSEREARA